MPAKIADSYTKAPAEITAIGDSHTLNYSYDVRGPEFYPQRLAVGLAGTTGRALLARNWGISGDTTRATSTGGSWTTASPGMLDRIACITGRATVPDLAVIYASTNNWTAMSAGGSFVNGGAIATGDVDEDVTLEDLKDLIDALVSYGVPRIVVVGYHLRNWASGGDVTTGTIDPQPSLAGANPGTFGHGSRWAAHKAATVYGAATYPGKVAFCNLYTFFQTRLESATYSAQIGVDTFLHVGASNTHLNVTGEQWVADAIAETVAAQSGWIAALTAA